MTEEKIQLGGIVEDCIFHYETDVDFPEPPISFKMTTWPTPVVPTRYFVIGQNKPPIQNGLYVEGPCFRRNLSDGLQKILVVDKLTLFDKKDGKVIASYEP